MRKNLLTWAILAPLATVATVVHADMTVVQSLTGVMSAAPSTDVGVATFTFSGLSFPGFNFTQLTGAFSGRLTSVSVNATLDASEFYTYADDLTIYVDILPLSSGGLLQVGGYSSLSAAQRYSWGNGDSSAPGTTVISTVTLATPLTFAGTAADPAIWLGNGYGDPDAVGTWTGSISLTFSPAAVPEPAAWGLFAAGGLGLMAWVGRRRRAEAEHRS